MKLNRFCEIYDVTEYTVYAMAKQNKWSKSIVGNGKIDYDFLMRRHKFKAKILDEASLLYYYLNKYFEDRTLAYLMSICTNKSLEAWTTYFSNDMFLLDDGAITKFKIKGSLWLFYRKARAIVRYCFNKIGVKYNIKKVEALVLRW